MISKVSLHLLPTIPLLVLLAFVDAANAAERTVTIRHRVVYEQVSQPFPNGRPRWSEAVVTRMSVEGDGSILVEGASSRTFRDTVSARRRNGETVDAGGYTVTYVATPSEWTIRSDYPAMTVTRSVRFDGAGACWANVDYVMRGGGNVVLPNLRGGETEFASIRAVDVTCRVGDEAEPERAKSVCDIDSSRVPEMAMRVSADGVCAWGAREGIFRPDRFTVIREPRNGSVEITPTGVVYRPRAGHVGADDFVVLGVRIGKGPPERRFKVEVVR